ncbi:MAG: hypothetical protein H0U32_08915 [Thermoleophilaceae bacterium]|nr:hypothetical protein [Thermoleophilaceae bacterium]
MPEKPDAAFDVRAALERTVSGGIARIELSHEFSFKLDAPRASRPGGLPSRRLIRWLRGELLVVVLRGVMRLFERWWRRSADHPVVGFVDFETQRCMCGDPSLPTATLVVGDRTWKGPFGTTVPAASADDASTLQPLWLIDLARGVVEAREQTAQVLHGRACRRFSAHADLNRAAEMVPYQLAIPTGTGRLDQLRRIPVEVWVDDEGRIRRIRHAHASDGRASVPLSTTTVDLLEFEVELPADWSRLPTVPPEPRTNAA